MCFPAQHLKKDVRIAFTASLTHSLQGLSVDSVIIFDAIAINLGKGYSNTTGIFTCPADGNYFIMTTLMSGPGSRIHAEVVLDNTPKAAVFAQSSKYFMVFIKCFQFYLVLL